MEVWILPTAKPLLITTAQYFSIGNMPVDLDNFSTLYLYCRYGPTSLYELPDNGEIGKQIARLGGEGGPHRDLFVALGYLSGGCSPFIEIDTDLEARPSAGKPSTALASLQLHISLIKEALSNKQSELDTEMDYISYDNPR